jgi:transposase
MGKHIRIRLTSDQRQELEGMVRAGESSARTLTRARILLLTDQGRSPRRTDQEIASALLCSPSTVRGIRRRFHKEGLQAALHDRPRPGAVPRVTGEVEAQLAMLACSTPPEGHVRWTLRLLADEMVRLEYIDRISHVTVREHLKKTNYSPGR